MTERCPTIEELVLLLDGQATETRAAEMRAHVAACPACRRALAELEGIVNDLEKDVPGVAAANAVDALMARIARAEAPRRARVRTGRWAAGITALMASAAAWMLLARPTGELATPPGIRENGAEFQARGSSALAGLERDVGLTLHVVNARGPVELGRGAVVTPDSKYVASYRNVRAVEQGTPYLALFAVDQDGVLHWLYPAYEKPGDDPNSVPLEPSTTERAMSNTVVLDQPTPGAMRFVALVTDRPVRVSQIEALSASELTLTALRQRFPDASLRQWSVEVSRP